MVGNNKQFTTREILTLIRCLVRSEVMGKNKKGHNWKSRQNVSGHLDDKETKLLEKKVAIEVDKVNKYF